MPPKKCKDAIKKIYNLRDLPKPAMLSGQLNPLKQNNNKKKIRVSTPKVRKYPGAPDGYGRPIKDFNRYYQYLSALFDSPICDNIEDRIKEMEEWTIALIDDGYVELS